MKRFALLVLALVSLAGCGTESLTDRTPAEQARQDAQAAAHGDAKILLAVTSACDEHGNRIYVYDTQTHPMAVVGQDPTCKGAKL